MAPDRKRALAVLAACLAVGASRFLLRARVPDDYDSIGFVRALDQFDLATLQPHPPGYPVFVALAKLIHLLLPALDAACALSSLAAMATAFALYQLSSALFDRRAGAFTLALFAVASMPMLLGGAAWSESTAGAFAAASFALHARRRPAASALAIALMLGVRASWWPLALSWLWLVLRDRAARRRPAVWLALVGGVLIWLVPFALVVGPAKLWTLSRTHVAGHFGEWGGTVVTRPNLLVRAGAFLRDWLYDGLAPVWPLLLAALALIGFAARGRTNGKQLARVGAVVVAPYALWALFAQNVIEQPRHLFPLVLATLVVAGALLSARPLAGVAVSVLLAVASLPLAIERVRVPPAAAQLASYVESHYPPSKVMVFGARSLRFLPPSIPSSPRTWLSEVDVDLERVDVFPEYVLVTSEVEPDRVRARRLHPVATFCRDRRLDRQTPCLTLSRYVLGR